MKQRGAILGVIALLIAVCAIHESEGVIGIDLGSNWMKMATIRGNEFSVILDSASQRKIVSAVGFSANNERYFGPDAERMLFKNPTQTYLYASELLGKSCTEAGLKAATSSNLFDFAASREHLTYRENIRCDPERGTYMVQLNETHTLSIEEIMGMLLNNGRLIAEAYTSTKDKDVVITVPPYFTMEQRAALIEAAKLAKLNVLSLMNSGTAVALHFAFGRQFEETPQYVVFYDMGSSSTKVSVVEFRSVAVKQPGKRNATVPQLKVVAVGWDPLLGGRAFTRRIAEHMAEEAFNQMKAKGLKPVDVRNDVKAFARLLAASEKAKLVLSANTETNLYVESLVDDFDFRATITRESFEGWCADLFARVASPLIKAVEASGVPADQVKDVEIVGGAVRIPKVQAVLREALGVEELNKHLNGDEAAVLGAVFYAAQFSTTMRVPDYRVKDMCLHSIRATLVLPTSADSDEATTEVDAETSAEVDEEVIDLQGKKEKKVMLFKGGSRLGTRKNLSFHTTKPGPFTVELAFAASEDATASEPIATYTFNGLDKALKFNYTGKPKVVLGFRLTTSGLVELERSDTEITVVKYPEPEEEKKKQSLDIENLLKKVKQGDKEKLEDILKKHKEKSTEEATGEEADAPQAEEATGKETTSDEETAETEASPEAEKEDDQEREKKEQEAKEREEKRRKPKKYTHRVALDTDFNKLSGPEYKDAHKSLAQKMLEYWDNLDFVKKDTADAHNDLETFIYATKDKMYDKEVATVSTEEQRQELVDLLSDTGDWLDEQDMHTTAKEYRDKLAAIKKLSAPIFFRLDEVTRRPKAIAALQGLLNSTAFISTNITKRLMVEEEELLDFLEECNETETWLNEQLAKQADLLASDEPVLRSEAIMRKGQIIERRLSAFLKRRPRTSPSPSLKPKKKPVTVTTEEDGDNKETADSGFDFDFDAGVSPSPAADDAEAKTPTKEEL